MDWVLDNLDGEMENDIADQLKSVDAILLGQVTYQIMANYWPTATAAGTSVPRSQGVEDPIITDRMNNSPIIVFFQRHCKRLNGKTQDWLKKISMKRS